MHLAHAAGRTVAWLEKRRFKGMRGDRVAGGRAGTGSRILHVVSLGMWGGGAFFFSFLTTPRIFDFLRDRLPDDPLPGVTGITTEVGRRLAGDVVGQIFPVYFAWQIGLGAVAVATGIILARSGSPLAKIRLALAAAALALVF